MIGSKKFSIAGAGILKLALLSIGLSLVSAPANAVIYSWTGTCSSGCIGNATGELVLSDTYVPGTLVSANEFIGFSYTSSSGAFTIPGSIAYDEANSFENNSTGLNGPLPAVSGLGGVFVDFVGSFSWFSTDFEFPGGGSVGSWQFLIDGTVNDIGSSYEWTVQSLPLPAVLPLFGTGLGLMGLFGWFRRRRAAEVAYLS